MVAALFIGNTGQVKIEEAICFLLNEVAAPVMKAACISCADGIAEGRQGLFVQGSCFPGMLYRIVPFCGGSASDFLSSQTRVVGLKGESLRKKWNKKIEDKNK